MNKLINTFLVASISFFLGACSSLPVIPKWPYWPKTSKVQAESLNEVHSEQQVQAALPEVSQPPIQLEGQKTKPTLVQSLKNLSFLDLVRTLFESNQDRAERIGPAEMPPGQAVPEPPKLTEYSINEIEKGQIDPVMGQLVRDFELAKLNDAEYQSALLAFRTEMLDAKVAGLAYYPSFNLANRFLDNESSSRTTISITQPLFNLDRIATLKEEDSRKALAQAQMKIREFELVERVFQTVGNLILAGEKIRVNESRITSLEGEYQGAKRELELGRGTITDLRDSEVRVEQARAEQLQLESSKKAALRTLEQITGRKVNPDLYVLRRALRTVDLPTVDEVKDRALQFNSALIQSRARQRLAELGALRARGQYVPSVSFSAVRSYSDLGDNQNSGVTFGFDVPVNASTFSQAEVAAAKISQAQLDTRKVRQDIEREIELKHSEVELGVREINIRLKAIEAAELSRLATEKSYKGGVRTRIDVLNSVQTLYVVNEQYINSVVNLAKSYLTLSNRASNPVGDTVNALQVILF